MVSVWKNIFDRIIGTDGEKKNNACTLCHYPLGRSAIYFRARLSYLNPFQKIKGSIIENKIGSDLSDYVWYDFFLRSDSIIAVQLNRYLHSETSCSPHMQIDSSRVENAESSATAGLIVVVELSVVMRRRGAFQFSSF